MRYILIIALLAGTLPAFSKDKKPKVDIKDDTVTVDGKASFILAEIKKAKFETKDYFLKDLSGKKIALIQSDCYEDPTRLNPDRYKYKYAPTYLSTCYTTITFLESKQVADFAYFHKQSRLAEYLIESELVKDGVISKDAEDEFVLVHGTKNAEEKSQKLGGNTIIINNNGSAPVQKNGNNISINKEDE